MGRDGASRGIGWPRRAAAMPPDALRDAGGKAGVEREEGGSPLPARGAMHPPRSAEPARGEGGGRAAESRPCHEAHDHNPTGHRDIKHQSRGERRRCQRCRYDSVRGSLGANLT